MIRYRSSYRALSLKAALDRAKSVAGRLGISRVTNITRLDRTGIPVFASIRPNACAGSLCVHAGKGMTTEEARVGALMEAIEFACAEPGCSNVDVVEASPRHVLDGRRRPEAILDLCPLAGIDIPREARLPCVEAEDLDGRRTLFPADLVFYPFPLSADDTYFGATTNGLASGVSQTEALVHGLFETIERDIMSFERVRATSQHIDFATLPPDMQEAANGLLARGFELALRWAANEFGIACVRAVLWDRGTLDPIYISEGSGCHLDPEVALARALTEAVQSRLSFIHGGRDDIAGRYARFARRSGVRKRAFALGLIASVGRKGPAFDFARASNPASACRTLDDLLSVARSRLERRGIDRIIFVPLTSPDDAVQVIRVVVPRLEFFASGVPRVGARLLRYVQSG